MEENESSPRNALCAISISNADNATQKPSGDHLSLKPSHTNFTEGVKRSSKVDFMEEAESENGALLERDQVPSGAHEIPFDSLLLAEGESSRMLRNLGFSRKLVRYSQAIGIIVNLKLQGRSLGEAFIVSRSNAEWEQSALGVLSNARSSVC